MCASRLTSPATLASAWSDLVDQQTVAVVEDAEIAAALMPGCCA
jgi:hypothetical protein